MQTVKQRFSTKRALENQLFIDYESQDLSLDKRRSDGILCSLYYSEGGKYHIATWAGKQGGWTFENLSPRF